MGLMLGITGLHAPEREAWLRRPHHKCCLFVPTENIRPKKREIRKIKRNVVEVRANRRRVVDVDRRFVTDPDCVLDTCITRQPP